MAADIACTSCNQNGHYPTQLPAAPRRKRGIAQRPDTQAGLRAPRSHQGNEVFVEMGALETLNSRMRRGSSDVRPISPIKSRQVGPSAMSPQPLHRTETKKSEADQPEGRGFGD